MGVMEDYAKAVAEFMSANADVNKLAQQIGEVLQQLEHNRRYFCFSNADGNFPIDVVGMPKSTTSNGNDWRSAKQINQYLATWHNTRTKVMDIWRGLPPEQQRVLQSPPKETNG